jgi:uncharacterized protein
MTPELRSTLIKVAVPLLTILIPLAVAKLRGFDVRELFGLHRPRPRVFILFIVLWIVWMAITELILQSLGLGSSPWKTYPMTILVLRVLAIGVVGPIAEEFIFRGLAFGKLVPKIGVWPTIIGVGILFGLIHFGASWGHVAFICLDGILFGTARHKSGSVYTPMAMHAMGNLLSIYQSLS